jgi:hypothetical protein
VCSPLYNDQRALTTTVDTITPHRRQLVVTTPTDPSKDLEHRRDQSSIRWRRPGRWYLRPPGGCRIARLIRASARPLRSGSVTFRSLCFAQEPAIEFAPLHSSILISAAPPQRSLPTTIPSRMINTSYDTAKERTVSHAQPPPTAGAPKTFGFRVLQMVFVVLMLWDAALLPWAASPLTPVIPPIYDGAPAKSSTRPQNSPRRRAPVADRRRLRRLSDVVCTDGLTEDNVEELAGTFNQAPMRYMSTTQPSTSAAVFDTPKS